MTKLETNGVRDMIFQDKEYIKSKITVDQTADPDGYKKQLDDARNNKVELPNPPVLPQDLVDLIQERYMIAYENFSK